MQKDWKRDPIWQLVGVILAAVGIFGLILPSNAHGLMVAVSVIGFLVCGLVIFGKSNAHQGSTHEAITNNSTIDYTEPLEENIERKQLHPVIVVAKWVLLFILIFAIASIAFLMAYGAESTFDAILPAWLMCVDILLSLGTGYWFADSIVSWLEDKLTRSNPKAAEVKMSPPYSQKMRMRPSRYMMRRMREDTEDL